MGAKDSFYAALRAIAISGVCPDVKFFTTPAIDDVLRELYDEGKKAALRPATRTTKIPWRFLSVLSALAREKSDKYPLLWRGDLNRTRSLLQEVLTLKRKTPAVAKELLKLLEEEEPSEETILPLPVARKEQVLENLDEIREAWENARKLLRCAVKLYEAGEI